MAAEAVEGAKAAHSLPKGICHGDYNSSNIIFKGNEMGGLVDFDNASYTYLVFDIANFLGYYTRVWPMDYRRARSLLKEYVKHRPLSALEKKHLFDGMKLSVVVDSLHVCDRYEGDSFDEKKKSDDLVGLAEKSSMRTCSHDLISWSEQSSRLH